MMFLEVYVFNSLTATQEQVYNEETLPDFPPPEILKKRIEDQVPGIKWVDVETGTIETSDYQGQLLIGSDRKIIYFRIVNGSDPLKLVMHLCQTNGWTSYTPENELFLDSNLNTLKYWQAYKTYKGNIDDIFYKNKQVSASPEPFSRNFRTFTLMINLFRKLFRRGIKNYKTSENKEFTGELSYLNDIPKLDIIGTINLSDIIGKTITDISQEFCFNKIDNWMDYSMTFITLDNDMVITIPKSGNSTTSIVVSKSKNSKRLNKQFNIKIIGQQISDFYFYFFEDAPDSSQSSYLVLSNGYAISEESIGIHGTGMANLYLFSKEEFEQIINDKEADIRSFKSL